MTYFILLLIYFALLGVFGIWLPSIGIDFGKSIPSIFGAIIAVQVFNHRAHRPNFSRLKLHYRQRYAEYIGNAFDGKRKQEKTLYLAIDDIHSGNYKRTKNAAKQLLKLKAETDDEQFVREVFFGMAQKEMHDIPEAILAYRRAFKIKEEQIGFFIYKIVVIDSVFESFSIRIVCNKSVLAAINPSLNVCFCFVF